MRRRQSRPAPEIPPLRPGEATQASLILNGRKAGAEEPEASEAARALQRARMEKLSPEERSRMMSDLTRGQWASMTAKERRIEQKRRAAVRKLNRRKRILAKLKGVRGGGNNDRTGGLS